jgi:hypothetical protein
MSTSLRFWASVVVAALVARSALAFDGDDAFIRAACPRFAAWQDQQRASRDSTSARPVAPIASDRALRDELLRMADADQAVRRDMSSQPTGSQVAKLLQTDANNLARIKSLLRSSGFPLNTQVGDDGVAATFLLVQHASDKTVQSQVLQQLAPRVKTGQISGDQFALLTDRVLAEQGKPQIYGTQLKGVEGGELALAPIAAPENVDQRRQELGMPPLADYLCVVKAAYAAPARRETAR